MDRNGFIYGESESINVSFILMNWEFISEQTNPIFSTRMDIISEHIKDDYTYSKDDLVNRKEVLISEENLV